MICQNGKIDCDFPKVQCISQQRNREKMQDYAFPLHSKKLTFLNEYVIHKIVKLHDYSISRGIAINHVDAGLISPFGLITQSRPVLKFQP